jgi:hypothetical protein
VRSTPVDISAAHVVSQKDKVMKAVPTMTLVLALALGCRSAAAPMPAPVTGPQDQPALSTKLLAELEQEKQLMESWFCVAKGSPIAPQAASRYKGSVAAAKTWLADVTRLIREQIPLTSGDQDRLRDPLVAAGNKLGKARLTFVELMLEHQSTLEIPAGCPAPPPLTKFACGPDVLACAGAQHGPFASTAVGMMFHSAKGVGEAAQRTLLRTFNSEVASRLWR